ncbi:uncharacterized protein LOC143018386 [Oratosquilla oratoria]|uniref:uncharacterized protein LOC143018386 n=1 Tax=Oratosquilla oratoria TaxID=337810 RepID=UPI003F76836D
MAPIFLFLNLMSPWNLVLITNLVKRQIQQVRRGRRTSATDTSRTERSDKESAQLLGSRLREKRLLVPGTTFYWYRDREREIRKYFTFDETHLLVYCNNISDLIQLLGLKCDTMEWSLFIDSSNRSFKEVFLNNGNKFSSIPVGHSDEMKETHNSMDRLLSALNFKEHKWLICGDLKVVGLTLGLRG